MPQFFPSSLPHLQWPFSLPLPSVILNPDPLLSLSSFGSHGPTTCLVSPHAEDTQALPWLVPLYRLTSQSPLKVPEPLCFSPTLEPIPKACLEHSSWLDTFSEFPVPPGWDRWERSLFMSVSLRKSLEMQDYAIFILASPVSQHHRCQSA